MTVKQLKKQLAAAIAMVVVAALALGASTYAWFVNNNEVTANTATISAKSNAPFLVISNDAITATSVKTSVNSKITDTTELYPVQMIKAENDASAFTWESAYASAANASAERDKTRFVVSEDDEENYYLKETFHIGTNGTTGGQFKNLRVSKVEATPGTDNDELKNALRVMVVCDEEVAIYDSEGTLITTYKTTAAADSNIAGLTAAEERQVNGVKTTASYLTAAVDIFPATANEISDKTVDVYLYYDGAVANVYTNNLTKLGTVSATVTFTADDAAAPETR